MSRLDPRGEEFFTQSERGGGPIDPVSYFYDVYESLFFLTQDENNQTQKNGKVQLLKCDKSFVLQNLENYELYRYVKLFSEAFHEESKDSEKEVKPMKTEESRD